MLLTYLHILYLEWARIHLWWHVSPSQGTKYIYIYIAWRKHTVTEHLKLLAHNYSMLCNKNNWRLLMFFMASRIYKNRMYKNNETLFKGLLLLIIYQSWNNPLEVLTLRFKSIIKQRQHFNKISFEEGRV